MPSRTETNGRATNGRVAPIRPPKPGPGHEVVTIELITPAMADEWLAKNTHNRDLRGTRVVNHAGALLRGEWKLVGDAIVFDEDGKLANGQHRLSAISLAGQMAAEQDRDFEGIRAVVLRGVEADAQEVMDQGLSRKLGDALKLRKERHYTVLAASLGYLHRLKYAEVTGNINYSDSAERPTTPQSLILLEKHPEIRDFTLKAMTLNRVLKMRSGVAAALYYTFSQLDADETEAFFGQLLSGEGLKGGDPILALRRQLINEKLSAKGRMPHYRESALIIKGWNYWREGRHVQTLSWHFGGSHREAFPIPK